MVTCGGSSASCNSCSDHLVLFSVNQVSRVYRGYDGFHVPGLALSRQRCGGGFRGDDGCTPSLGLSVDTDVRQLHRDSDSPLVWVAQKPLGGSPGPRSAGVYIGDGCCQ